MKVFASASLSVLALAASTIATPILETRQPGVAIRSCTIPNTVALTFDDGPYIYQSEIIDQLAQYGAKATFFVNGRNFGCIYDQANVDSLQRAIGDGHQIASHTWSHPHLTQLSGSALTSEFTRINDAIQKITGAEPAMMRPPYGEYNDEVLSVAASQGQSVIIWDFDSGDSAGASPDQSIALYDNAVSSHPSTILTLNHEVHDSSVHQVLPHALEALTGAGYNLVTVAECLRMDAYNSVGSPSQRDSSWTC